MKYFKLINQAEWPSFNGGIIYKSDFELGHFKPVGELAKLYPKDWQEVPKPKKSLSEKIEKLKKQAEKEGMKCEVVLDSSISKTASFAFEGTNTDGIEIKLEGIVSNKWISGSATFTATNTKDEWEGVEYAECLKSQVSCFTVGKIYRVNPSGKGVDVCDFLIDNNNYPNGFAGSNRKYLKPSTESAYVEQLKAKAKELYGDLVDGDLFEHPDGGKAYLPFPTPFDMRDLKYRKEDDLLTARKYVIYSQGKWGKKLNKRAKAHITQIDYSIGGEQLRVEFTMENSKSFDPEETSRFLASQLEKYLNGEIGKEDSNG